MPARHLRETSAPSQLGERSSGRVARLEFAVYGARSLAERLGHPALDQFPWLAWDERLGARLTEKWMKRHVPDVHIVWRVDSTELMIQGLRLGVGIAFLPVQIAATIPELVQLREAEPGLGMDVWVLTHPDLRSTACVSAFMEFIAAALKHRLGS